MALPLFLDDGYLPKGLHEADESEVIFRFGSASRKRRTLVLRLREWIRLARNAGALRFLLNGSFVTTKPEPNDVDAVVLVDVDFESRVQKEEVAAQELYLTFLDRRSKDLFMTESERDWFRWVNFFAQTREADGRQKGVVEVRL